MRQNMFNTPPLCNFLSFKSITYLTLLFGICFISLSVWAGGSIFGGGKHKTSNPNGVYSIGVHICSSLECPDIRIISGSCDGEHMEKRWGVCICDKGYVSINGRCWACPEGQYSDGIHGCTGCEAGTYKENDADTSCKPCPEESYCVAGKAYACPEHADCSATDFTCHPGFTKTTTGCECSEGKFVDENGVCRACPIQECPADNECCTLTGPADVCGNPTPVLGFKDNYGNCISCSSLENGSDTSAEECAKCKDADGNPTRTLLIDHYCALIDCPSGYIHDPNGECFYCPIENARYCNDEGKATYCISGYFVQDGACVTCPEHASCNGGADFTCINGYTKENDTCICGKENVQTTDGQCKNCSASNDPYDNTPKAECDKCANREIVGNSCVLTTDACNALYPEEGGYRDSDGNCHSCLFAGGPDSVFVTTEEECAQCGDKREYIDGMCLIANCGTGKYRSGYYCEDCPDEHATACDSDGKATDCKEGYEVKDGKCEQTCLTSGKCTSNEGLCIGYYCKADAEVESNTETCHTAEGDITHLPQTIPTISENGFTYHISDTTVTWDAAYYYCEAVGTQLAKDVKLAWPKKSDGTDCPASQNCPNWTNTAIYWLNKSEYVKTVTPTPYGNITTTTPGDNLAQPSDDFCYTWAISNKYVRHSMLRTIGEYYYALCE